MGDDQAEMLHFRGFVVEGHGTFAAAPLTTTTDIDLLDLR
jgi:hypothetical protein